jgi:fumarate hydratase class II
MPNTRAETDSLGAIEVPTDALYGAQMKSDCLMVAMIDLS